MKLYFHVRSGPTLIEDPDGAEFDSLYEAVQEARGAARDLLAERLRSGRGDSAELEIWSHDGAYVHTVGYYAREGYAASTSIH